MSLFGVQWREEGAPVADDPLGEAQRASTLPVVIKSLWQILITRNTSRRERLFIEELPKEPPKSMGSKRLGAGAAARASTLTAAEVQALSDLSRSATTSGFPARRRPSPAFEDEDSLPLSLSSPSSPSLPESGASTPMSAADIEPSLAIVDAMGNKVEESKGENISSVPVSTEAGAPSLVHDAASILTPTPTPPPASRRLGPSIRITSSSSPSPSPIELLDASTSEATSARVHTPLLSSRGLGVPSAVASSELDQPLATVRLTRSHSNPVLAAAQGFVGRAAAAALGALSVASPRLTGRRPSIASATSAAASSQGGAFPFPPLTPPRSGRPPLLPHAASACSLAQLAHTPHAHPHAQHVIDSSLDTRTLTPTDARFLRSSRFSPDMSLEDERAGRISPPLPRSTRSRAQSEAQRLFGFEFSSAGNAAAASTADAAGEAEGDKSAGGESSSKDAEAPVTPQDEPESILQQMRRKASAEGAALGIVDPLQAQ